MSQVTAGADQIVSKAEFARLRNVSRGRVSQWIGEEKISGEALVGKGRDAKIRVAVAVAQLRRRLDVSQSTGLNGLDTDLSAPASSAPEPVSSEPPAASPAPLPSPPAEETIEDQIKRERLESLQRQNRKLAEEEAARAGRYVLAEDMTRELGRVLMRQVAWFEGSLTELATAISAKFAIPQRDVLHLLRTEFRSCRERATAAMQTEAQAMPRTVEDDEPLEEESDEPAELAI